MKSFDYEKLSKIISHALRHEAKTYNLSLDKQGWVLLSDLLCALKSKGIEADEKRIRKMIDQSNKKRHQILNGKIRAYYGHSKENIVFKNPSDPPEFLYHGTLQNNLKSIFEIGLIPMQRQFVHLSFDEKTAKTIAKRNTGEWIILKILAKEASMNGTIFYKEENNIWMCNSVMPKYIIVHGTNRN
ncbi:MAG: RNA 2'-phosphotransferase [Pedobacter sp.]|nr:RNA 2'-phosphotransferase [Pedobacter sp.]